MGPRGLSTALALSVALSGSRALAEDIGHDPLEPAPSSVGRAPPPPGAGGPSSGEGSGALPPSAPRAAAEPENTRVEPGVPSRHWYGWETLLADGAWILGGSVLIASDPNSGELFVPVVGDYFLGPPLIHLGHGHVGKAFGSLGLRLSGPLLLVLGVGAAYGSNSDGSAAGLAVFGALMIPAAVIVDAAALAREDVEPEEDARRLRLVGFSPWMDRRTRSAGLSLTLGL